MNEGTEVSDVKQSELTDLLFVENYKAEVKKVMIPKVGMTSLSKRDELDYDLLEDGWILLSHEGRGLHDHVYTYVRIWEKVDK